MTMADLFQQATVLKYVGGSDHLHIVLNDPAPCPFKGCDCVVLVAISSVRPGKPIDPSCLLDVGDHPFIRHQSYVVYADARVYNAERVQQGVDAGDFQPHDTMSLDAFQRVIDGLVTGQDRQRGEVNKFLRRHRII